MADDQRTAPDPPNAHFSLLFPLVSLAAFFAFLPVGTETPDLVQYFIPWMAAVHEEGISAISAEFANYTPPYIYLMYAFSWLVPFAGHAVAIKAIPVPFIALMAYSSYRMIVHAAGSTRTAMMAGAAICVAPTLLVNAFIWGQADVIYTCFLVLFVHLAMRGHSLTAMVMFGVALSFKLQAMFLSPMILYLVLSRQVRIWHAALIPVAFGLMMLPAYLAGRSGWALIRIYLDQAETLELLAVFAPNAWFLVDLFNLVPYSTGVIIGFCTSFLAALAIALLSLRLPRGAVTTLFVAAICAATMPFLLPKMHDRYFFVADILTILVALSMSRLWAVPFLFQFGSLLAYLRYFELSEYGPAFGFVPISFGVVLLWSEFAKAQRGAPYSVGSELKEWLRHPLSGATDGTRAT